MATKVYDVLGIGVAAVDDLLYVENYPPPNIKVPILRKERHGGGPACTAMAAVGTLQGRACFLGRFGKDELSAFIRRALLRHGVDIQHLLVDSDAAPYHSAIVVDASGIRNVFYDPSMYRPIEPEQVSDSLIQSSSLVLLDHVAEPSLLDVAQKVRRLQVPILGDIEGCSESARQLANTVDYLVVPEEFALWASNSNSPSTACVALAQTKRLTTVVTSGTNGAHYCVGQQNTAVHIPAFPVQTWDSNGCGDTFHGAYALAVAREFPAAEAILFASAAAAIKAFAGGGNRRGWDALPTRDEILSLLREQGGGNENREHLLDRIASTMEIESARAS
jgi:sugar/nucleoside kinase (ribokinase family)